MTERCSAGAALKRTSTKHATCPVTAAAAQEITAGAQEEAFVAGLQPVHSQVRTLICRNVSRLPHCNCAIMGQLAVVIWVLRTLNTVLLRRLDVVTRQQFAIWCI